VLVSHPKDATRGQHHEEVPCKLPIYAALLEDPSKGENNKSGASIIPNGNERSCPPVELSQYAGAYLQISLPRPVWVVLLCLTDAPLLK
jgi:hypothetical protein